MSGLKGITKWAVLTTLLFLLLAVAGDVKAAQEEPTAVFGMSRSQLLSDSALSDIRGKGSLIGFGNGLTGVAIQINQGSATQVSKIDGIILSEPGTQVQPLPPHLTSALQGLQRLFQKWKR